MERSSHPSRILSVTGTETAPTVASISDRAWSSSRLSAEPDCPPGTCWPAGGRPRWTTNVDIDDGGAAGLCDARALRHPGRLTPCQLDDVRAQPLPFGTHPRLGTPLGERRARRHLRDDQARPQRGR